MLKAQIENKQIIDEKELIDKDLSNDNIVKGLNIENIELIKQ